MGRLWNTIEKCCMDAPLMELRMQKCDFPFVSFSMAYCLCKWRHMLLSCQFPPFVDETNYLFDSKIQPRCMAACVVNRRIIEVDPLVDCSGLSIKAAAF
jgi:hypothetical protein